MSTFYITENLISKDDNILAAVNKLENVEYYDKFHEISNGVFEWTRSILIGKDAGDYQNLQMGIKINDLVDFYMIPGVNYNGNPWGDGKEPKGLSLDDEPWKFGYLGYIFQLFFGPTSNGVINSFLGTMGIEPVKWLSKGLLPMVSVILANVWRLTGWHACIYLARLQGISEEYYEAARIDGGSKWNIFWYITFPLLAPAMTISIMFIIIDGLKIYALPYALTGGGPGYRTTFMTQLIIETGIGEKMVGRSSAMAVIFFIVIMIVALIQLYFSRKREESLC